MEELEAAFGRLLTERCTPDVVRGIEAGGSAQALWDELCASGFVDALVPEENGGAGLALRQALPLVQACGYHAVPLPFAQTMAARAVLARAGHARPDAPLDMAVLAGVMPAPERLALHAALTVGLIAGAAGRVLEMSLEHARQRTQFGKPIGSFQAVQHQLAVMAEQVCAARMAAQLCFASDSHLPRAALAAMAKSMAGDAAAGVAAAGHAIHGAIGITAEFGLQLYTRRLLAWRVEGGSPAYWNSQVGRAWQQGRASHAIDFVLEHVQAAAC